jgi:hypothetical protein
MNLINRVVFVAVLAIAANGQLFSAHRKTVKRDVLTQYLSKIEQNSEYHCLDKDVRTLTALEEFRSFSQRYYYLDEDPEAKFQGMYATHSTVRVSDDSRVCDMFIRWKAITADTQSKRLPVEVLERKLEHCNYLLNNLPQKIGEVSGYAEVNTEFATRVLSIKNDLSRQLFMRHQETQAPIQQTACEDETYQYELANIQGASDSFGNVRSLTLSHDGLYISYIGVRNGRNHLVVAKPSSSYSSISLVASVALDDSVVEHPTKVTWGYEDRTLLLAGCGDNHAKVLVFSFEKLASRISEKPFTLQSDKYLRSASLETSSDGQWLVALLGGNATLWRWDRKQDSYQRYTGLATGYGRVDSVSVSPNGHYIAIVHNQAPYLRFCQIGQETFAHVYVEQPGHPFSSVVWHPSKMMLVGAVRDVPGKFVLMMFDEKNFAIKDMQTLYYGASIKKLSWSSDGMRLLVCGDTPPGEPDGVRTYRLLGNRLVQQAIFSLRKGVAQRNLEVLFDDIHNVGICGPSGRLSHMVMVRMTHDSTHHDVAHDRGLPSWVNQIFPVYDLPSRSSFINNMHHRVDNVSFPRVTTGSFLVLKNVGQADKGILAMERGVRSCLDKDFCLRPQRRGVDGVWYVEPAEDGLLGKEIRYGDNFTLRQVVPRTSATKGVKLSVEHQKGRNNVLHPEASSRALEWCTGVPVALRLGYSDGQSALQGYLTARSLDDDQASVEAIQSKPINHDISSFWSAHQVMPLSFVLAQAGCGNKLCKNLIESVFPGADVQVLKASKLVAKDFVHESPAAGGLIKLTHASSGSGLVGLDDAYPFNRSSTDKQVCCEASQEAAWWSLESVDSDSEKSSSEEEVFYLRDSKTNRYLTLHPAYQPPVLRDYQSKQGLADCEVALTDSVDEAVAWSFMRLSDSDAVALKATVCGTDYFLSSVPGLCYPKRVDGQSFAQEVTATRGGQPNPEHIGWVISEYQHPVSTQKELEAAGFEPLVDSEGYRLRCRAISAGLSESLYGIDINKQPFKFSLNAKKRTYINLKGVKSVASLKTSASGKISITSDRNKTYILNDDLTLHKVLSRSGDIVCYANDPLVLNEKGELELVNGVSVAKDVSDIVFTTGGLACALSQSTNKCFAIDTTTLSTSEIALPTKARHWSVGYKNHVCMLDQSGKLAHINAPITEGKELCAKSLGVAARDVAFAQSGLCFILAGEAYPDGTYDVYFTDLSS